MAKASGSKAEVKGLIGLSIAGLLGLITAVVAGEAPVTHIVSDWVNWARLSPLYAALAVFAAILSLFSAAGALHFGLKKQRQAKALALRSASAGPVAFAAEDSDLDADSASDFGALARSLGSEDQLAVPDDQQMQALRAGNVFAGADLPNLSTPTPSALEEGPVQAVDIEAERIDAEPLAHTEPASEEVSFEAPVAETDTPSLEETAPVAHLSEPQQGEEPPLVEEAPAQEAIVTEELLAFASHASADTTPPESEPEPEPEAVQPLQEEAAAEGSAQADQATEVAHAVQTALSVWPDNTRGVAAKEVAERIASLYINKADATQAAFAQIASGELNGAASTLAEYAAVLVDDGKPAEAADIWRAIGALFMGRDDSRALSAYSKVSELDAEDGNVHLFLARRHIQAGELSKLPAVAERALAVIGDPATRAELLAPYAEQMLKNGDVSRAAGAFEELKDYKEKESEARPDDLMARSTYAVSLAQLAQAHEKLSLTDTASDLYRKAHLVFLELNTRLPEHAGLKSMAENALKDAQRLDAAQSAAQSSGQPQNVHENA